MGPSVLVRGGSIEAITGRQEPTAEGFGGEMDWNIQRGGGLFHWQSP